MSDHALCLASHDDKPAQPEPGLAICTWHRNKAANALASLPAIHGILADYLIATGGSSGSPVHVSKDPGIRLDQAVYNARRDIETCLATWVSYGMRATIMRFDPRRGAIVKVPRVNTGPDSQTPRALAQWLLIHHAWYLAQDTAGDFVDDVMVTASIARSQRQHNHSATFQVGPCPEPDCDGTLITRIRPVDSLLPSIIWCDKAPEDPETGEQLHTWPADKWLTLGRKVHREELA